MMIEQEIQKTVKQIRFYESRISMFQREQAELRNKLRHLENENKKHN